MTKIRVTQIKGLIGQTQRQKQTVAGLGLRRIRHTVELKDTPAIRGMIRKVQHLVEIKVLPGEAELFGKRNQD